MNKLSPNLNLYPTVVQVNRHPTKTSSRYSFIPTTALLEVLDKQGWVVNKIQEARANAANQGYQKHIVRLQNPDMAKPIVGGLIPELVVVNSHNCGGCFELRFGLFRIVCTNGLIVGAANFGIIKIRHFGYSEDDVIDASFRVIEKAPQIVDKVNSMHQIEITAHEQIAMTRAASILRFGSPDLSPYAGHTLASPRRSEDYPNDLLTVFNRIQENVINGGIRIMAANGSRRTSNPITSLNRDIFINENLWGIASEVLRYKEGGRLRTKWPDEMIGRPIQELHSYISAAS